MKEGAGKADGKSCQIWPLPYLNFQDTPKWHCGVEAG
jgi:hypothetical protein